MFLMNNRTIFGQQNCTNVAAQRRKSFQLYCDLGSENRQLEQEYIFHDPNEEVDNLDATVMLSVFKKSLFLQQLGT